MGKLNILFSIMYFAFCKQKSEKETVKKHKKINKCIQLYKILNYTTPFPK